ASAFLVAAPGDLPQLHRRSLHDDLPIYGRYSTAPTQRRDSSTLKGRKAHQEYRFPTPVLTRQLTNIQMAAFTHAGKTRIANVGIDRKSTRLNSSHVKISYAVFCLKIKNI